jgi:glycosyltransferase involved in cell wall biosynthesis
MTVSDVNVVICTYARDDAALLRDSVAATAAQAADGRTIVVDMSSDGRMLDGLNGVGGITRVHLPQSSGLGESREAGLLRSSERYVAFLDSDAVPHDGWLGALREAVGAHDVAVAGGPVLPRWPQHARVPPLFRTTAAGDFLSMLDLGPERADVPRVLPGNMIVDRESAGDDVFNRELGRRAGNLLGAEEISMMVRLRAAGNRIVYEPRAAVDHHTAAERMKWRWMWRRVEAAGRESLLHRVRLEPMPRRVTARDHVFLAAVAPAYAVGSLRARRALDGRDRAAA